MEVLALLPGSRDQASCSEGAPVAFVEAPSLPGSQAWCRPPGTARPCVAEPQGRGQGSGVRQCHGQRIKCPGASEWAS